MYDNFALYMLICWTMVNATETNKCVDCSQAILLFQRNINQQNNKNKVQVTNALFCEVC